MLITIASAITAVILVMRQSLKRTASKWSNGSKGGGESGGGDEGDETDWTPVGPAAKTLNWLSENLLFVVFSFVFAMGKREKVGTFFNCYTHFGVTIM